MADIQNLSPKAVKPIELLSKTNEVIDAINEGLNSSYTELNPLLTSVEGICTWTVTHNLDTENVSCSLYDGDILVLSAIETVSENAVTVTINSASNIPAETYRIVVIAEGSVSSSGGGGSVSTDYPRVYIAQGAIATSEDNSAKFYGLATVMLYGSGVAFIDFVYKCTQKTSNKTWNWGLDSQALHTINPNIPLITPTSGAGHWISYYAQANPSLAPFNFDALGYATAFVNGLNRYWVINRVVYENNAYTDATSSFIISTDELRHDNMAIKGTAYGTFVV